MLTGERSGSILAAPQHPIGVRFGAAAPAPHTGLQPARSTPPAPIRIHPRSPVPALHASRLRVVLALAFGLALSLPRAASAQSFPHLREFIASLSARPVAASRAEAQRDSVVALARRQMGVRYVLGGTSPERGFDCSGFLQFVMRGLDVRLPRTANEQAQVGEEVPPDPSRLLPGDILTFGQPGRITHVGMYIGGGRFIHASTGSRRIVEARLDRSESSLVRAWTGVRRMLRSDSTQAVAANR